MSHFKHLVTKCGNSSWNTVFFKVDYIWSIIYENCCKFYGDFKYSIFNTKSLLYICKFLCFLEVGVRNFNNEEFPQRTSHVEMRLQWGIPSTDITCWNEIAVGNFPGIPQGEMLLWGLPRDATQAKGKKSNKVAKNGLNWPGFAQN